MQINLVASVLFLCACGSVEKEAERIPLVSESREELEPQIAELKRLYNTDQSEHARRAVFLRAVDEGVIRRGAPVSSMDGIFGTHFASQLPTGNGGNISKEVALFAPQFVPPPRSYGRAAGVDYVGWYLAVDYDQNGVIQNYYLTNLHKGNGSPRVDGKVSVSELRRLYEMAQSEVDRRVVCLRAIDEGALITYRPVSQVDEIFKTEFASHLPSRKESIRKEYVEFVDPKTTGPSGWFLAIEYDFQGTLLNYYLTNVPK